MVTLSRRRYYMVITDEIGWLPDRPSAEPMNPKTRPLDVKVEQVPLSHLPPHSLKEVTCRSVSALTGRPAGPASVVRTPQVLELFTDNLLDTHSARSVEQL